MDRIDQYSFYYLGKTLQALASHTGEASPSKIFWDFISARSVVHNLTNGIPVPTSVSRVSCNNLQKSLDEINEEYFSEKNESGETILKFPTGNDSMIPEWRLDQYRRLLSRFETIFSAEMQEATSYFVPRRGIYSTVDLIDAADKTFPSNLFHIIPEKSKQEWRSAGRCLAFNLLSASGFHVARAVEGMIEAYLAHFAPSVDQSRMSWGNYIDELEKVRTVNSAKAPSEKAITELRQMKDDFRNPLMHPRVVLNESDARVLFANGESLIVLIAEEIRAASS